MSRMLCLTRWRNKCVYCSRLPSQKLLLQGTCSKERHFMNRLFSCLSPLLFSTPTPRSHSQSPSPHALMRARAFPQHTPPFSQAAMSHSPPLPFRLRQRLARRTTADYIAFCRLLPTPTDCLLLTSTRVWLDNHASRRTPLCSLLQLKPPGSLHNLQTAVEWSASQDFSVRPCPSRGARLTFCMRKTWIPSGHGKPRAHFRYRSENGCHYFTCSRRSTNWS